MGDTTAVITLIKFIISRLKTLFEWKHESPWQTNEYQMQIGDISNRKFVIC